MKNRGRIILTFIFTMIYLLSLIPNFTTGRPSITGTIKSCYQDKSILTNAIESYNSDQNSSANYIHFIDSSTIPMLIERNYLSNNFLEETKKYDGRKKCKYLSKGDLGDWTKNDAFIYCNYHGGSYYQKGDTKRIPPSKDYYRDEKIKNLKSKFDYIFKENFFSLLCYVIFVSAIWLF